MPQLGVLGVFVPETYGGVGLGHTERVMALEEIARHSAGLAMGADEAFLLSDIAFGGADTYATSYVLAKAIERLGAFDLILFGISGAAHHLCGISDSDVIVNINCEKAADSLAASDFIGVMDAGEVIDRLLEMLETVPIL